ncbi:acylamino-acid-releasing enzyme-like isoform X1 [Amphibalanus amphitrite]|uniref:acylamino-acid-releasing enzyme-like isoform X1 n=1 Tax=Amphibalanus amphitrite TaxID=1232801 RepID=UPI001C908D6B|nr:acylamino-acid-releasing enzyme-like isoform X1 [Amphibalanus amphitrite]
MTEEKEMSKMATLVDSIVKKTRVLTRIPTLLKASVAGTKGGGVAEIQTTWSQSVVETAETVQFERTFVVEQPSLRLIAATPSQNVGQNVVVCYSPSHQKKAVFRKKEGENKKEKWLLEIWSQGNMSQVLDLTAMDKHGAVYSSGDFSSFQWSDDERLLLYIAEKRRPPAVSFFDENAREGSERGAESRYYADWGEQQTGQHRPVVVVLDAAAGQLTVLAPPQDVSLGQARWRRHGDTNSVVAIAWENQPRRLGLIYCSNRASHVLELPVEADAAGARLSGEAAVSCRSPRVSPDGSAVLWLESAAGGPHHAGARLMRRDMNSGAVSVLIDLVDVPEPDGFSGLYLQQLPTQCWVSDTAVCFSTPVGTGLWSLTVDTASGARTRLEAAGVTVLAATPRLVVGARSGLLQPPELVVLPPAGGEPVALTEAAPASAGTVRPLTFSRAEPAELATLPYSGLLVLPPAGATPAPLIMFPHGGPHGVMTDAWSAHVALFNQLGLAVLLINYRGSTGAGERSLHALPGRVSTLDVADCEHAARQVLSAEPSLLDAGRVAAYGGSHGGFLVTHLSGQHPDLVKAVVARNPVCDIAGMLEGTDIPDWNHVESGEAYDPLLTPTPQRLAAMLTCSPISHVDSVRAATLLMVGTADRRVPPYQVFYYGEALRQRGVPAEVRVYDDCHPLAKAAVNGDVMVHAATWMCEKLDHSPPA